MATEKPSYLNISTRHIKKKTFEMLEVCEASDYLVFSPNSTGGYGLFVYVSCDIEEVHPNDLQELFDYAIQQDAYYLRLSPDGDDFDNLPTYEW